MKLLVFALSRQIMAEFCKILRKTHIQYGNGSNEVVSGLTKLLNGENDENPICLTVSLFGEMPTPVSNFAISNTLPGLHVHAHGLTAKEFLFYLLALD